MKTQIIYSEGQKTFIKKIMYDKRFLKIRCNIVEDFIINPTYICWWGQLGLRPQQPPLPYWILRGAAWALGFSHPLFVWNLRRRPKPGAVEACNTGLISPPCFTPTAELLIGSSCNDKEGSLYCDIIFDSEVAFVNTKRGAAFAQIHQW